MPARDVPSAGLADISRPIYGELLLIRFLSCPWEPLCGISRISPASRPAYFRQDEAFILPPPPLPPGSPKRVNLVRLYFFINLSGSALERRDCRRQIIPTLHTLQLRGISAIYIYIYQHLGRGERVSRVRIAAQRLRVGGLTPYSCGNLDSRPARSSEPWKSN